MAEEAQAKISRAVESMIDDVEKKFIRPLQKNGYLCSAKCFDATSLSAQQLQQCVERCQEPLGHAQQILNNEMGQFQNRLERCSMDCQDEIRDKIPAGSQPSGAELTRLQEALGGCLSRCANTSIGQVPALKNRLEQSFKQLSIPK